MKSLVTLCFAAALLGAGPAQFDVGCGLPPQLDNPPSGTDTVHIRGVAYQFLENGKVRLEGAEIKVAEYPNISVIAGKDGNYDLEVPDQATVTPYIIMPGYHTVYLQTFTTNGRNIENVHFETPTNWQFRLFEIFLLTHLTDHGCAILTTVSKKELQGLPFEEMLKYKTYGIPGVVVHTVPTPIHKPIYFGEHTIPEFWLTSTTIDGGVVWPLEDDGVYVLSGTLEGTTFEPFVATCKEGRLINASVPHGIYQHRD